VNQFFFGTYCATYAPGIRGEETEMRVEKKEEGILVIDGDREILIPADMLEVVSHLSSEMVAKKSQSNWDRLAGNLSAAEFADLYNSTSW